MGKGTYMIGILAVAVFIIMYLFVKQQCVSRSLRVVKEALEDIRNGNLNRRVLAKENDMTKQICYTINEIAMNHQKQMVQQKQSEQAYKRLMTSLSHDVKTPLSSLVGYLEAVESGLVTGEEKQQYICVATDKAHHLKDFVESLFEWVKLDAGEQVFRFEICDLNEATRDIMADWILILENNNFDYEIEIPEEEYSVCLDYHSYNRIINNLLQNVITHSEGDKVGISITEKEKHFQLVVWDNGIGIEKCDLPHVFERMYQCDYSRLTKGNGLGLAITKELVRIHKGTIIVESNPGKETKFVLSFPKVL